jgi:hypothetical protein
LPSIAQFGQFGGTADDVKVVEGIAVGISKFCPLAPFENDVLIAKSQSRILPFSTDTSKAPDIPVKAEVGVCFTAPERRSQHAIADREGIMDFLRDDAVVPDARPELQGCEGLPAAAARNWRWALSGRFSTHDRVRSLR